jgi:hypothetical protein
MAGSGGGAGPGGSGGGGTAGVGGTRGAVVFDPSEGVYSVALSVNPTGVTKTLALRNGGSTPVTVSALAVTGTDASRFVTESAPALPATVAAGNALNLTVRFAPPSNSATATFAASLSATLSGASSPTAAAGLYGLAMSTSNAEATFDQVVKTLGYAVNVGGTSLTLGTGAAAVGEEVLLRRFKKVSASEPVRLEPVARYSPFEAAPYGYYTGAAPNVTRHPLGTMSRGPEDNVANRTLFPPLDTGAMLTFDPGMEPFGIFAESQSNTASLGTDARFYQEDSLNDDQGSVTPVHRLRIYPLKNRAGQTLPNTFLVGCEEASNSDYQDYVFVISNVTAATN